MLSHLRLFPESHYRSKPSLILAKLFLVGKRVKIVIFYWKCVCVCVCVCVYNQIVLIGYPYSETFGYYS